MAWTRNFFLPVGVLLFFFFFLSSFFPPVMSLISFSDEEGDREVDPERGKEQKAETNVSASVNRRG